MTKASAISNAGDGTLEALAKEIEALPLKARPAQLPRIIRTIAKALKQ